MNYLKKDNHSKINNIGIMKKIAKQYAKWGVQSVIAGENIEIDNTDQNNPVVNNFIKKHTVVIPSAARYTSAKTEIVPAQWPNTVVVPIQTVVRYVNWTVIYNSQTTPRAYYNPANNNFPISNDVILHPYQDAIAIVSYGRQSFGSNNTWNDISNEPIVMWLAWAIPNQWDFDFECTTYYYVF